MKPNAQSEVHISIPNKNWIKEHCLPTVHLKVKNALKEAVKALLKKEVIQKLIKALSWSELDAENWIIDKKFHKEIAESLLPCNGKLLNQLFEMYNKIPDYFYSSLNGSKTIRLRDLLYFSNELKEIFEK